VKLRFSSPSGSWSPPTDGGAGRVDIGFTTPLLGVVMSLHALPATVRDDAMATATITLPAVCRVARPVFTPSPPIEDLRPAQDSPVLPTSPPCGDRLAN